MSYVVYRSSNDDNRKRNYQRTTDTTNLIRVAAGFASFGFSGISMFFAYQAFFLILSQLGMFGFVSLLLISFASLIYTTVRLFSLLEGKRIAAVFAYIGLFGLSFLLPGLPVFVSLFSIGVSFLYATFAMVSAVSARGGFGRVLSNWIAIFVTAIPIAGAYFYAPRSMKSAGLEFHFRRAPISKPTIGTTLQQLDQALADVPGQKVAVVSYQIRDNRLYADLCRNGKIESIALPSEILTRTPVFGLEWNLSRVLDRFTASDQSRFRLNDVLAPVLATLNTFDKILIADGALVNFPHQQLLQRTVVLRTFALDGDTIRGNLQKWHEAKKVSPSGTVLLNALPQSQSDLGRLGLQEQAWDGWKDFYAAFDRLASKFLPREQILQASKMNVLDSLKNRQAVLLVVAHSDGFSVALPTGETIRIDDLEQIKAQVQQNKPTVLLLSCETARLTGNDSFAKELLDIGANAVIATTDRIRAADALGILEVLFDNAFGPKQLPFSEAVEKAIKGHKSGTPEIWLGRAEPSGNHIPGLLSHFNGAFEKQYAAESYEPLPLLSQVLFYNP